MFEILLPEVYVIICQFLRASDRARVAMVSKSMAVASRASFTYRSCLANGELPESDRNNFTILLNILRFSALTKEPTPFSKEVREIVKSVHDIGLLSALDIAKLG